MNRAGSCAHVVVVARQFGFIKAVVMAQLVRRLHSHGQAPRRSQFLNATVRVAQQAIWSFNGDS